MLEAVLLPVVYNLCFVVPLLAIVVVLTVAGDRSEQLLTTIRESSRAEAGAMSGADGAGLRRSDGAVTPNS